MSIKDKILSALNIAIEDISEATLIQVLIDAYKQKCKQIKDLEHANDAEKIKLDVQQDAIKFEMERIRRDPTLLCAAEYYFYDGALKFNVIIKNSQVEMIIRKNGVDFPCKSIKEAEYNK